MTHFKGRNITSVIESRCADHAPTPRTDAKFLKDANFVIHNETVYLSGQTGGTEGSIIDQTENCLRCVDNLLSQAGSSKENIQSAIILLADMNDLDDMMDVWENWIPEGHAHARACGSARLAAPTMKVEMMVTAALSV